MLTTIMDKKGRTISIGYDGGDVVAWHKGREVARWVFDEQEDVTILAVAEMETDYERAGIGTAMLIFAEEVYADFSLVDHLSMEGAAFFNASLEQGKMKYSHSCVEDDRY